MSIRIIEDYLGGKKNLSTHREIFPSLWSIYLYTYVLLLKLPTPPGCHRAPSWVPCAVHQLPTNHLCYTRSCIYVRVYIVCICQWHSLWSPHAPLPTWCPQVLSLWLSLSSCPANRFLCTIFSRLCIHALIWSSSPTTGHMPWENHIIRNDTRTPVFTAALFTITGTRKRPECPSIDEGIKTWPTDVAVVLVTKSCPALLWPHRLLPARLLHPWDSPGKNTRVGCHSLLQGMFPTQGSNPCLLRWWADSLPLSRLGSPWCLYTMKYCSDTKRNKIVSLVVM